MCKWVIGWFFLVGMATLIHACDVPVFRYALERWAPDAYHAVIFHRGPLKPTENALIEEFRGKTSGDPFPANLEIQTVNLAGAADAATKKLWASQSKATLPWVVLKYPAAGARQGIAWSGPLDANSAHALTDSPARREIARRLLAGDSVTWLFLEIGDTSKDEAAAAQLKTLLAKTEQVMKLPSPVAGNSVTNATPNPLGVAPNARPLELHFSILRISRKDPMEQVFIRMLLNTEEGLDTYKEPMTFPIFGQGRALYVMIGRGINEDNVAKACLFLGGACSCEVKAQNPGTDLLMAVDWQRRQGGDQVPTVAPPPLTSLSAAAQPGLAEKLPSVPDVGNVRLSKPISSRLARSFWYGVGGLAAVVGMITLLMRRRGTKQKPHL